MAAMTNEVGNEAGIEAIRQSIFSLGFRTPTPGKPLISPKGAEQSWLIDLRTVFMHRSTLERIAQEFWALHREAPRFQIGGMESAGIPLLTALLLSAPDGRGEVNGFIMRKERKTTGEGNSIEGRLTDEPIVFVDDILNSGASAEKARMVLAAVGRTITETFVVIDYRSQRGLRWRDEHGIDVRALFTLTDFNKTLNSDRPPLTQRYKELWHAEVPGGYAYYLVPKSAPLLDGNRLYRGCDAGKMHAFDTVTGAVVWEYQTTGAATRKGIWSTPAIHDGRLYFGAYNGCIYCLDAQTGQEIWTQSYGEWVGASPVIVPRHGLIYFGIEYERPWAQGSIGGFNLSDGRKVWEHRTQAFQHGSAIYWQRGDLVIWGTADHEMLGIEAKTGVVRWRFKTRRSVKYSPSVDEGRSLVAFASFDKSIYLLDAATGEKLGEWETGEICYTTPLFAGDKLFCGSGDRHLYVIDIDHIKLVKRIDLHARVYASPTLVDGRVLVATTGGRVVEIDVATLEIKGGLQLPDAITNAIAISDNGRFMYVSTYMNHLYAFERLESKGHERVPAQQVAGSGDDVALIDASSQTHATLQNFRRVLTGVNVDDILREVTSQPQMWLLSTSRQDKIAVQRETESIFLRAAVRASEPSGRMEDIHESRLTPHAERFPLTMQWVDGFAKQRGRRVARVLLAKLKSHGQVYPHTDGGGYYRLRDRYHLVLSSTQGSPMVCGDEEVTMHEGDVWWFDNKLTHAAFNRSGQDRVHLIFDLENSS